MVKEEMTSPPTRGWEKKEAAEGRGDVSIVTPDRYGKMSVP